MKRGWKIAQRFTGVDPLASEMAEWSPFNYTFNNPLKFIDPDGRMPSGPDDPWYKRAINAAVEFVNYVGDGISNAVSGALSDLMVSSGYEFGRTYIGDGTMEGNFEAEFNNASQALVDGLPDVAGQIAADAALAVTLEAGNAMLRVPTAVTKPLKGSANPKVASAIRGTDYIVTPKGEAIKIPDGAAGPTNPNKGSGMVYQGGAGGKGMDSRTTGVRIMDANSNQGRRVNYMNKSGQTVDPVTGRTISNKDPRGHLPLKDY